MVLSTFSYRRHHARTHRSLNRLGSSARAPQLRKRAVPFVANSSSRVRAICMGMCLHQDITEEGKKAKLRSSKIEQDLCEHARTEMNVVKILMLGAAESGKSTLIKQIKIIHSHGFSKQELISFKPAVLDNLLTSMKFVLRGMGMLRINLANKKNKMHARSILSCSQCFGDDQELLPFVAHAFCALWSDQGVRAAAARGYEFELNDSALYFFENMNRIIAPKYVPTETDVLRVRVRTCGIVETQFQLNEIIFRRTSLILLMNKTDLFQEKILHSGRHLRFYLSSYKGADGDVDAAAHHITAMFSSCNSSADKPVYHHFTTATDTANIQDVLHMVIDQIIKENLAAVQLL
ncbi:Guanine nucleotide-binding protein G(o) subunit alpha [Collichthys lucidus]|uniref:Guanine nucleotide-binding protein G(O) subunit alpha n=1 Tax=Collichthys lucidus TaxID=240159 RepID=A0A4U5VTE8_COLLU|nr:Guanine nucleotide-binding protein G(o) subunit alpha [Collichthys lucidus]